MKLVASYYVGQVFLFFDSQVKAAFYLFFFFLFKGSGVVPSYNQDTGLAVDLRK